MAGWMEWVVAYVNRNLPSVKEGGESTGLLHGVGQQAGEQVAYCDQCDLACEAVCPYCGAGLHSMEHTERHVDNDCGMERNGGLPNLIRAARQPFSHRD